MPVVIAELVLVVGLFFAVVGYLVARGLLATWTHSLGWLLETLAAALSISVSVGFKTIKIDFGGPVRALDHKIISALQAWADGAEIEMGYCLHGLARVGGLMAEAIDLLARETSATFEWILKHHLPKWAKVVGAAAFPFAWASRLIAHEVARLLPRFLRLVHVAAHAATKPIEQALTIPHLGEIQWIHRHWKALTAALAFAATIPALPNLWQLPHGIGIPESWVRWRTRVDRRLTKVEGIAAAGVMAGLMANVLGVSARCLRSGNVGKMSRALCGAPTRALEDLLGLVADFFILENVCALLPYLETGISAVALPVVELLTVAGSGICAGTAAAPALVGPMPSVPALVFGVSASGV